MLRRRSLLVLAPVVLAACVVVREQAAVAPCSRATLVPWATDAVMSTPLPVPDGAPRMRIASYNVHSGLGGGFALRRSRTTVERNLRNVAAAIADAGPPPDAIALNEVDFAARRSGGFDQAAFLADEIARRTGTTYEVAALETWRRTLPGFEVRFGNALLLRHPVIESVGCLLDDASPCVAAANGDLMRLRAGGVLGRLLSERRGVLRVTLDVEGQLVDVLVTHLEAFVEAEREAQAVHLLHRFVTPGRTTILAGDVNAVPSVLTAGRRFFAHDRTHDILTSGGLVDARLAWAARQGTTSLVPWATFPAEAPRWPLDAILATPELLVDGVTIVGATASDHQGMVVDFALADDPAVVAEARGRHDAMRRRQLARIVDCDLGQPVARSGGLAAAVANLVDVATPAQRRVLATTLPGLAGAGS